MVERIDAVPVLAATPGRALPAHGGSVLALPSGDVAAALRQVAQTPRRATYELRVVNSSEEAVTAYTYALPVPAGGRVWQGALVPAFSSIAVHVEVPKIAGHRGAPVVAELHTAGTRLIIGAPPAGTRTLRPALRGVIALLLAVLVVGSVSASGVGRAHGIVRPLAPLPRPPQRTVSQRATHRRPSVPALRIQALHVPGSVLTGQSVRIDYRTQGTAGSVALVDEFGRTLARTELDPRGSSVLLVPNIGAAQDVNVVVDALRGKEHSTAAASLFVRPAPHRSPQPRPSASPSGAPQRAPASRDPDGIARASIVAPIALSTVQSVGRPIIVRVVAHPPALHLALFADGNALAERDVPAGSQRVAFPALSKPRNLSLITTYRDGPGEESTITSLSVR